MAAPEAFKILKGIENDFQNAFAQFNKMLVETDQAENLKFLRFKLDFNEYY
jgi:hypothetical protein